MKSFINCFASLSILFFAFTFLTIATSACKDRVDIKPVLDGWNETEFAPINDGGAADYELVASVCSPGKPQNFSIAVWYFDSTTSEEMSLDSLMNPGVDEEGEPNEPELPAESFDVLLKFNEEARDKSNYTKYGEMLIYLDTDQLAVIRTTDAAGRDTWHTHRTNDKHGKTCFTF